MATSRSRQFLTADEDYEEYIIGSTSVKNTKRVTKLSVSAVREYCQSKEIPHNFESLLPVDLERLLDRLDFTLKNPKENHKRKQQLCHTNIEHRDICKRQYQKLISFTAEISVQGVTMEIKTPVTW